MKKIGKILLTLALMAVVVSGCGSARNQKTLKVGVRDDIMGLGYLNSTTGEYYGLEIDLAKELAKDLGYSGVELITVVPATRKDMLLNGEVDCLIAAYSIEETRLENFDFSPAYYTDHTSIVVEKSSMLQSINDLVGRKTGVLKGANTAPKLSEKLIELGLITAEDAKGSSLEQFETYDELSQALEEGRVDAACMDGGIARAYLDDSRIVMGDVVTDEKYGVATQKGSALSKQVADSVQKMLDDGTMTKLIDKWN